MIIIMLVIMKTEKLCLTKEDATLIMATGVVTKMLRAIEMILLDCVPF